MQEASHLVVIGASAGGVSALLQLSQQLPAAFAAPVCIVQHVGAQMSLLPELLRYRGANHAMHVQDGQHLTTGTLHIAPPDHHLLVDGDTLRLTRGPKENYSRPAIDPLFRSAALTWGPRVIGVILTGMLDDGSAGLKAVKQCGGVAIVQDPDTALEPQMPRSALASVAVDHRVPLEEIAPLLVRLIGMEPAARPAEAPEEVAREVAINRGEISMENLAAIANPSSLGCPECGGGLWEMKEQKPLRYRCHTGHAYSALSLAHAQALSAEEALRSGVRALRERQMLLRRMAGISEAIGDPVQAAAGRASADRLDAQIRALRGIVEADDPVVADPAP
jgi:two-component system chemotaxis response regulator CheB